MCLKTLCGAETKHVQEVLNLLPFQDINYQTLFYTIPTYQGFQQTSVLTYIQVSFLDIVIIEKSKHF